MLCVIVRKMLISIEVAMSAGWTNYFYLFIFDYLICELVDPVKTEWFVYESESWIWLNSKRLQQLKACWKENVQWKLTNISTCSSQKKCIGFKRPEILIHVNYFNDTFMSFLKLEGFSPVHCNFMEKSMEIRHHMFSFVFHGGWVNDDWIYILGELFL